MKKKQQQEANGYVPFSTRKVFSLSPPFLSFLSPDTLDSKFDVPFCTTYTANSGLAFHRLVFCHGRHQNNNAKPSRTRNQRLGFLENRKDG